MYEVPGMQLMPQDRTNACWYASALMVLQWRRRGEMMSPSARGLIDPSAFPTIDATYRRNNGLQWSAMKRLAHRLGLRELPLMTPSVSLLEYWSRSYGPV